MNESKDLKELGTRLRKVDQHLILLLSQRMKLALQVEKAKRLTKDRIFRPQIEDERLQNAREWARQIGLNPHFAHAILYLVIDESCKVQLIQMQEHSDENEIADEEAHYQKLKKRLLELTERIAPSYDEAYDKAFFATHSYLDYEKKALGEETAYLDDRSLALDLGCATGRLTFKLARDFDRLVGYDLSPHMIEYARASCSGRGLENLIFETVDLENGIPQVDSSASMIVMSLGTASDMRNIQQVLSEAARVLKKDGRFLFSFYNADALVYRWGFIPWPVSLAAEVNLAKHCLDVHCDGEIYSIYANPYTKEQAKALFPKELEIMNLLTYPTISSVLPNDLFENDERVQESIAKIDRKLADADHGAYIIATGRKR